MPRSSAGLSVLSDNTESSIHSSIVGLNSSFSPNLSFEKESVLQDDSHVSLRELGELSFIERLRASANESDVSFLFPRGSLNEKKLKKRKRKPTEPSEKLDESSKTSDDSSLSINLSSINDSFFKKPKEPPPKSKSPFSNTKGNKLTRKVTVAFDPSGNSPKPTEISRNKASGSKKTDFIKKVPSRKVSVNFQSDSSSGSIDDGVTNSPHLSDENNITKNFARRRVSVKLPDISYKDSDSELNISNTTPDLTISEVNESNEKDESDCDQQNSSKSEGIINAGNGDEETSRNNELGVDNYIKNLGSTKKKNNSRKVSINFTLDNSTLEDSSINKKPEEVLDGETLLTTEPDKTRESFNKKSCKQKIGGNVPENGVTSEHISTEKSALRRSKRNCQSVSTDNEKQSQKFKDKNTEANSKKSVSPRKLLTATQSKSIIKDDGEYSNKPKSENTLERNNLVPENMEVDRSETNSTTNDRPRKSILRRSSRKSSCRVTFNEGKSENIFPKREEKPKSSDNSVLERMEEENFEKQDDTGVGQLCKSTDSHSSKSVSAEATPRISLAIVDDTMELTHCSKGSTLGVASRKVSVGFMLDTYDSNHCPSLIKNITVGSVNDTALSMCIDESLSVPVNDQDKLTQIKFKEVTEGNGEKDNLARRRVSVHFALDDSECSGGISSTYQMSSNEKYADIREQEVLQTFNDSNKSEDIDGDVAQLYSLPSTEKCSPKRDVPPSNFSTSDISNLDSSKMDLSLKENSCYILEEEKHLQCESALNEISSQEDHSQIVSEHSEVDITVSDVMPNTKNTDDSQLCLNVTDKSKEISIKMNNQENSCMNQTANDSLLQAMDVYMKKMKQKKSITLKNAANQSLGNYSPEYEKDSNNQSKDFSESNISEISGFKDVHSLVNSTLRDPSQVVSKPTFLDDSNRSCENRGLMRDDVDSSLSNFNREKCELSEILLLKELQCDTPMEKRPEKRFSLHLDFDDSELERALQNAHSKTLNDSTIDKSLYDGISNCDSSDSSKYIEALNFTKSVDGTLSNELINIGKEAVTNENVSTKESLVRKSKGLDNVDFVSKSPKGKPLLDSHNNSFDLEKPGSSKKKKQSLVNETNITSEFIKLSQSEILNDSGANTTDSKEFPSTMKDRFAGKRVSVHFALDDSETTEQDLNCSQNTSRSTAVGLEKIENGDTTLVSNGNPELDYFEEGSTKCDDSADVSISSLSKFKDKLNPLDINSKKRVSVHFALEDSSVADTSTPQNKTILDEDASCTDNTISGNREVNPNISNEQVRNEDPEEGDKFSLVECPKISQNITSDSTNIQESQSFNIEAKKSMPDHLALNVSGENKSIDSDHFQTLVMGSFSTSKLHDTTLKECSTIDEPKNIDVRINAMDSESTKYRILHDPGEVHESSALSSRSVSVENNTQIDLNDAENKPLFNASSISTNSSFNRTDSIGKVSPIVSVNFLSDASSVAIDEGVKNSPHISGEYIIDKFVRRRVSVNLSGVSCNDSEINDSNDKEEYVSNQQGTVKEDDSMDASDFDRVSISSELNVDTNTKNLDSNKKKINFRNVSVHFALDDSALVGSPVEKIAEEILDRSTLVTMEPGDKNSNQQKNHGYVPENGDAIEHYSTEKSTLCLNKSECHDMTEDNQKQVKEFRGTNIEVDPINQCSNKPISENVFEQEENNLVLESKEVDRSETNSTTNKIPRKSILRRSSRKSSCRVTFNEGKSENISYESEKQCKSSDNSVLKLNEESFEKQGGTDKTGLSNSTGSHSSKSVSSEATPRISLAIEDDTMELTHCSTKSSTLGVACRKVSVGFMLDTSDSNNCSSLIKNNITMGSENDTVLSMMDESLSVPVNFQEKSVQKEVKEARKVYDEKDKLVRRSVSVRFALNDSENKGDISSSIQKSSNEKIKDIREQDLQIFSDSEKPGDNDGEVAKCSPTSNEKCGLERDFSLNNTSCLNVDVSNVGNSKMVMPLKESDNDILEEKQCQRESASNDISPASHSQIVVGHPEVEASALDNTMSGKSTIINVEDSQIYISLTEKNRETPAQVNDQDNLSMKLTASGSAGENCEHTEIVLLSQSKSPPSSIVTESKGIDQKDYKSESLKGKPSLDSYNNALDLEKPGSSEKESQSVINQANLTSESIGLEQSEILNDSATKITNSIEISTNMRACFAGKRVSVPFALDDSERTHLDLECSQNSPRLSSAVGQRKKENFDSDLGRTNESSTLCGDLPDASKSCISEFKDSKFNSLYTNDKKRVSVHFALDDSERTHLDLECSQKSPRLSSAVGQQKKENFDSDLGRTNESTLCGDLPDASKSCISEFKDSKFNSLYRNDKKRVSVHFALDDSERTHLDLECSQKSPRLSSAVGQQKKENFDSDLGRTNESTLCGDLPDASKSCISEFKDSKFNSLYTNDKKRVSVHFAVDDNSSVAETSMSENETALDKYISSTNNTSIGNTKEVSFNLTNDQLRCEIPSNSTQFKESQPSIVEAQKSVLNHLALNVSGGSVSIGSRPLQNLTMGSFSSPTLHNTCDPKERSKIEQPEDICVVKMSTPDSESTDLTPSNKVMCDPTELDESNASSFKNTSIENNTKNISQNAENMLLTNASSMSTNSSYDNSNKKVAPRMVSVKFHSDSSFGSIDDGMKSSTHLSEDNDITKKLTGQRVSVKLPGVSCSNLDSEQHISNSIPGLTFFEINESIGKEGSVSDQQRTLKEKGSIEAGDCDGVSINSELGVDLGSGKKRITSKKVSVHFELDDTTLEVSSAKNETEEILEGETSLSKESDEKDSGETSDCLSIEKPTVHFNKRNIHNKSTDNEKMPKEFIEENTQVESEKNLNPEMLLMTAHNKSHEEDNSNKQSSENVSEMDENNLLSDKLPSHLQVEIISERPRKNVLRRSARNSSSHVTFNEGNISKVNNISQDSEGKCKSKNSSVVEPMIEEHLEKAQDGTEQTEVSESTDFNTNKSVLVEATPRISPAIGDNSMDLTHCTKDLKRVASRKVSVGLMFDTSDSGESMNVTALSTCIEGNIQDKSIQKRIKEATKVDGEKDKLVRENASVHLVLHNSDINSTMQKSSNEKSTYIKGQDLQNFNDSEKSELSVAKSSSLPSKENCCPRKDLSLNHVSCSIVDVASNVGKSKMGTSLRESDNDIIEKKQHQHESILNDISPADYSQVVDKHSDAGPSALDIVSDVISNIKNIDDPQQSINITGKSRKMSIQLNSQDNLIMKQTGSGEKNFDHSESVLLSHSKSFMTPESKGMDEKDFLNEPQRGDPSWDSYDNSLGLEMAGSLEKKTPSALNETYTISDSIILQKSGILNDDGTNLSDSKGIPANRKESFAGERVSVHFVLDDAETSELDLEGLKNSPRLSSVFETSKVENVAAKLCNNDGNPESEYCRGRSTLCSDNLADVSKSGMPSAFKELNPLNNKNNTSMSENKTFLAKNNSCASNTTTLNAREINVNLSNEELRCENLQNGSNISGIEYPKISITSSNSADSQERQYFDVEAKENVPDNLALNVSKENEIINSVHLKNISLTTPSPIASKLHDSNKGGQSENIVVKVNSVDSQRTSLSKRISLLDDITHLSPSNTIFSKPDELFEPNSLSFRSISVEDNTQNIPNRAENGSLTNASPVLENFNYEPNDETALDASVLDASVNSQNMNLSFENMQDVKLTHSKSKSLNSNKSSCTVSKDEQTVVEKRYNLRKSSHNDTPQSQPKKRRKSVTFGSNTYKSPSSDEHCSELSPKEISSGASKARNKPNNSNRNVDAPSETDKHVFIQPEIPSRRSKDGPESSLKRSRTHLEEQSCDEISSSSKRRQGDDKTINELSYDSLDVSAIPKDKTMVQKKLIYHSTPINPILERKKTKKSNPIKEKFISQDGHSDKMIQVSKEGLGTSSEAITFQSTNKKTTDLSTSYSYHTRQKLPELSTSYSSGGVDEGNAKRKSISPDKKHFKRKKIVEEPLSPTLEKSSGNSSMHPQSSDDLYENTSPSQYSSSGVSAPRWTVRFNQRVQFKDEIIDSDSDIKRRNSSKTISEISDRSYRSGSMISTMSSSCNISKNPIRWGESSRKVNFKSSISYIHGSPNISSISREYSQPSNQDSFRSKRRPTRFTNNSSYVSENPAILPSARNEEKNSGSQNQISIGKETEVSASQTLSSDCTILGGQFLVPRTISVSRKTKLHCKPNSTLSLISKTISQKHDFKNDPNFVIEGKPYIAPNMKFPDKWVTKQLYQYFTNKLKEAFPMDASLIAERLISHVCGTVSAVKTLSLSDDVQLATLVLRKLLNKYSICSNQLEFYLFMMKFTPPAFQRKVLPMCGAFDTFKTSSDLKVSDPMFSESETIDFSLS